MIATGGSHSLRDYWSWPLRSVDLDRKEFVEVDPLYLGLSEVHALRENVAKAGRVLGWAGFDDLIKLKVKADLELVEQKVRG